MLQCKQLKVSIGRKLEKSAAELSINFPGGRSSIL